jgi:Fe-S-cluster-containing hydrogenase component 2
MDAIKFDADIYQVDMARCIGCGLCLSTCPAGAVSLVKKAEVAPVPENVMEMRLTIVKERGF